MFLSILRKLGCVVRFFWRDVVVAEVYIACVLYSGCYYGILFFGAFASSEKSLQR